MENVHLGAEAFRPSQMNLFRGEMEGHFLLLLPAPDSKSAFGQNKKKPSCMFPDFRLPEYAVLATVNHQKGSVYKLQHGKIFSLFLLTPNASRGKK